MHNSNHNFDRCIKLFSFSLYNQFLWKNSRTWDFEVKVGTLKMTLILEDIRNDYKTQTMPSNNLFEGIKHIVLMSLTHEKKTTASTLNSMIWWFPQFLNRDTILYVQMHNHSVCADASFLSTLVEIHPKVTHFKNSLHVGISFPVHLYWSCESYSICICRRVMGLFNWR